MDVLNTLRLAGRPLSDEELAGALGADRRAVVRECRRLAFAGAVIREEASGSIVNRLDEIVARVRGGAFTQDLSGTQTNG
jgi:DNA-binding GntR family transcriptional regulator